MRDTGEPKTRGPIVLGPKAPQPKLAKELQRRGWPMQELAYRMGTDTVTMHRIISGQNRPRTGTADAICEVLGKEWTELFNYERPMYQAEVK